MSTVKTHRARILAHLMKGHTLTQAQAVYHWKCYRLSARIHELKAEGYDIQRTIVTKKSTLGRCKRWAMYYIPMEALS